MIAIICNNNNCYTIFLSDASEVIFIFAQNI